VFPIKKQRNLASLRAQGRPFGAASASVGKASKWNAPFLNFLDQLDESQRGLVGEADHRGLFTAFPKLSSMKKAARPLLARLNEYLE